MLGVSSGVTITGNASGPSIPLTAPGTGSEKPLLAAVPGHPIARSGSKALPDCWGDAVERSVQHTPHRSPPELEIAYV